MGGTVSSARNNNDFVDNLIDGTHIRTPIVEQVFRAVDRGHYMTPETRHRAYRDVAWKKALLHMSAPCIYSEALEALELEEGLSFLNVGSGTGYFNTMVGLAVGPNGVNHGVEIHSWLIEYANARVREFMEKSTAIDELEFCEPKFFCGNGLCITNPRRVYDRIYCGAQVPVDYNNYFQQLLRVGGILVMPFRDKLLQIKRLGSGDYVEKSLLQVSFVQLVSPQWPIEMSEEVSLPDVGPGSLQALCRGVVRAALRRSALQSCPELSPPPHRPPPAMSLRSRRIRIPVYDSEGDLNLLSNFDELSNIMPAEGSREMNALVRIVLNMEEYREGLHETTFVPTPSVSSNESQDEEAPRDVSGGERPFVLENVLLNMCNRMTAQNGLESELSPISNAAVPDDDNDTNLGNDSDLDMESFADIESNSDSEFAMGNRMPPRNRSNSDNISDISSIGPAPDTDNDNDKFDSSSILSDSTSGTDSEQRYIRQKWQSLSQTRESKRAALKKFFQPKSRTYSATAENATTSTASDAEKHDPNNMDTCTKMYLNHATDNSSSDESDSTDYIPRKFTMRDRLEAMRRRRNGGLTADANSTEYGRAGGSGTTTANNGDKLDSGIGENSPGSGPMLEEATPDGNSGDAENGMADKTEEVVEPPPRRRGIKRRYVPLGNTPPIHGKRKSDSKNRNRNRQAFSHMLQKMVHSLPLPLALRIYINYDRSFDRVLNVQCPKPVPK